MVGKALVAASAVLTGAVLGAALIPPVEPAADPYDVTQVAENVYTFRWHTHRNLFVVTPDGVLVTDPLNPDAAATLLEEIGKVTAAPVKYVVYSHDHWDHVLGGQVFKDAGARFVSHAKCLPSFARSPHPDLVTPDETYEGASHTLELGGTRFELHYFGPNHGECLTVLRLPDSRLLYTVDIVNPKTVGYRMLPDFQPHELARSLREIERLDFDRIVPGHMAPVAPRSAVTEQRQYYEDLIEAVRTAMADGPRDPAELARTIRLPQYEDWAGYDDWFPLNVERVWAYYHMGW